MRLPKFEYIQPRSLEEARSMATERNVKPAILAGGTALMVDLRFRLRTPAAVMGMKALRELDYVRRGEDGGLEIGAMATVEELERSPLVAGDYSALAHAAQLVGVPPIRHVATIGGNLCLDGRCIFYNQSEFWRSARPACLKLGGEVCHAVKGARRCLAVYQGDLAPVLMALGARVRIIGAVEERVIPLGEFFTGNGERPNSLAPDDILAAVLLPPASGQRSAYEKLRVREGMDFPLAGVAVAVKTDGDGVVERARLVIGAVGPSPVEAPEAAQVLAGQVPTEEAIASAAEKAIGRARPVANLAMDPAYRRKMVGVLARRALRKALGMDNLR